MLDPVDQLVIVQSSQVTVEPGDTLFALSRRTGADISDLVAANALQPPYALQSGQKLAVPPLRYHIVNPGESGLVIARRYGVEWPLIARMNELQAPYTVRAGQRLRLPPVLDAAQRAAQFDVVIAAASAPPAARPPAARPPAVRPPAPVAKPEPDLPAHQPPPQKPPAAAPVAAKPAGETAPAPEPARPESAGPATPAETPPVAGQSVATAEARPAPLPESGPFTGRMSWPLDGRILSGFGSKGGGQYNDGINIAARKGQTVKAASDGVIAYVGDAIVSFGNLILIKHGQGWVTAYAHLDEVLVKRGDKVRAGEPIGKAGETGNVDRPQLHFEVREGKRARDPVLILPRRTVG